MTRLKCITLETSSLESNTYKTPKGNEHLFLKGSYTEIPDQDDVDFFLRAGNGEFFKVESLGDKITKIVEKIVPAKEIDETQSHAKAKKAKTG